MNMFTAYTKQVSGFGTSYPRPNPSLSLRTSDTRRTLYVMLYLKNENGKNKL